MPSIVGTEWTLTPRRVFTVTEKSKHQPKGYNEASDREEEDSDYTYDQDAFLYDPEEINIITTPTRRCKTGE